MDSFPNGPAIAASPAPHPAIQNYGNKSIVIVIVAIAINSRNSIDSSSRDRNNDDVNNSLRHVEVAQQQLIVGVDIFM